MHIRLGQWSDRKSRSLLKSRLKKAQRSLDAVSGVAENRVKKL